jgi:hypothetical protein
MQPLLPTDSPRHFLLPLPPGLIPESPELFGFFTYEFRIGRRVGWSTAQGRFGRPLRVTGVQHPAPTLRCEVVRHRIGIEVSARRSLIRSLSGGHSARSCIAIHYPRRRLPPRKWADPFSGSVFVCSN